MPFINIMLTTRAAQRTRQKEEPFVRKRTPSCQENLDPSGTVKSNTHWLLFQPTQLSTSHKLPETDRTWTQHQYGHPKRMWQSCPLLSYESWQRGKGWDGRVPPKSSRALQVPCVGKSPSWSAMFLHVGRKHRNGPTKYSDGGCRLSQAHVPRRTMIFIHEKALPGSPVAIAFFHALYPKNQQQ